MNGTLHPASGQAPDSAPPGNVAAQVDEWLARLARSGGPELRALLSLPFEEQLRGGYGHTLREIAQQPVTWADTASRVASERPPLAECARGAEAIVLTGSGSSVYAAECAAPWLQSALGLPVSAVPAGTLLTHPDGFLPGGAFVLVSLARSGDSPESRAVVDWALRRRPQARHVVLTCNRDGALATAYRQTPAVRAVVLDESTNDRSLVMTSSFTNLVLAARALGGPAPDGHRALAGAGAELLRDHASALARTAREGFSSMVCLGSGCRLGSAREAALKMLETNAGQVSTFAETFLGLRHGPMSAVGPGTLVLAFLSSDPCVRAYELDVLRELDRKQLGRARVLLGAGLPPPAKGEREAVRVDCAAAAGCDEAELAALDAVAGQLLALFRCLHSGRRPDAPSEEGVITRVVSEFRIHSRDGGP